MCTSIMIACQQGGAAWNHGPLSILAADFDQFVAIPVVMLGRLLSPESRCEETEEHVP